MINLSSEAIAPDIPHLHNESVATRQYAYLVQQMGEIINISNYVLKNLMQDDTEQWVDSLNTPKLSAEFERANQVEAQLQLERRRTFNSIMLCNIYDAFDLYCVRMRKAMGSTGRPLPGESSLDHNRRIFATKGLTFLTDQAAFENAVMIKDSRNLITHNHGMIDERFHNRHPQFSDGLNSFLRVYSEELQEHVIFLTRVCYELDGQVSLLVGLEVKPVVDWSGPSNIKGENEDE